MKTPLLLVFASTLILVGCSDHDDPSSVSRLNPASLALNATYPPYTGITPRDASGNLTGPNDPTQWNGTGSLASVVVYPNPWSTSTDSGLPITFGRLTPSTTIKIYKNPITVVRTLSGSNTIVWDLTESDGSPLPSATYHAVITAGSDQTSGNIEINR